VDGTDPALLKNMLETEILIGEERIKSYAEIYQAAGGYAPTMGIIGTVLGLLKVLGSLGENTNDLGPAIASAFIATFFGISFANIVFLPIGKKIKLHAKATSYAMEMILEGLLSIQSGDNPRITKEKLMIFAHGDNQSKGPAPTDKDADVAG
ncbi:MAG TPA: MotA/TolQ/ExbB proton channel family protein, partial [Bacillota bacterium]|nr:MotA/TolQ/ExbB proton channel family protein [Bacillota bacterium]